MLLTEVLLMAGFKMVEVLGPLICVQLPTPTKGEIALRSICGGQTDWSEPACAGDGGSLNTILTMSIPPLQFPLL